MVVDDCFSPAAAVVVAATPFFSLSVLADDFRSFCLLFLFSVDVLLLGNVVEGECKSGILEGGGGENSRPFIT